MDQLSEEEIRRTLEVAGLPENVDPEDVYGFFENARFGGGEVTRMEQRSMTKDGSTFITFKDEAVVTSLLARQSEKKIRVSGNPVELRRYEKPKPVPVIGKRIVVSGISSDLDQDDVLGIFENVRKSGGRTEGISSGDAEGIAVITFVKQSVAEHFVGLGEVTYGGSKLQIAWPMSDGSGGVKTAEEVICPRTIIVHDIAEGHMDNLELSLESKRTGGGKLESPLRRNPDGTVTATFVDENVAAKFLERGSVKVAGKTREITKPSVGKVSGKTSGVSEIPNTIEVSGIPETTSDEYLKMYFENKKRSGGGEIKTMTYDRQEGVATITFTDPNAVLKILERGEHTIESVLVQVTALESMTPDLIDQTCAVRVSNIAPTISQELITMYFESTKKSGGDDFDEFLFDRDAGCAVVVYKSSEVCRRVAGRSHQLQSVQLVVEVLKPAPPPPIVVGETDEKKLIVGDLPSDFKDEDLKLFLEKAAGCQITHFYRGPSQDLVLADFKSIPNYASLRQLVVSRPFQGQMIFVQKVKPSACVIVHGTKSISDDFLSLHFENPKRSGGGDIKNTRREGNGDVVIEFHDRKVIPTVLKKKQIVEGQTLKTEMFHDCLSAGTSGTIRRLQKIRIPEDVTVPVDKRVLKFISDSANVKTQIESHMKALNCSIQWQNPDDGTIKLCCTLTPGTKDVVKLATKWEAACSEQMITHLDRIAVKDEKICAEIWEEYAKKMKPIKRFGVSVEMDQTSHLLRLVGIDAAVDDYLKAAAEVRNRLLEELAKRKSKTFESLKSLKPNQLQLLRALNFPNGDQTISKELEINIDDHQVSFQGARDEINQAKIRMYELVNNISTKMQSKFDVRKGKFLQKGPAIDYFKQLFEKKNLKVFWNVKGQDLEVSGIADKEITEAMSLLDSEIQSAVITLDVNQLVLMKQYKWRGFKKFLEEKFKVVDVTEDMHVSTVTVVSTRGSTDQIENEIRDFLKHNTVLEQFIQMEEGQVAYIEQFFSQEMDDMQTQLSAHDVSIEVMQKKNSSGILVRGTKFGLEKAVKRLREIQQPILCTTHESDLYGIQRYFSSQRGKESKEKIENKNTVIVQLTKAPKNSGASGANGGLQAGGGVAGPVEKSTVSIHESVIKVVKGNVVECRVKALVIPIGGDLKHVEGVAKAVVEAGGQSIEDECQAHVNASGKLLPGQIYDSKPGSLSCSGIIHVALPPRPAGTSNEVAYLEDGIWKALERAEQKGWTSIAISGGTNYPPNITAKTIIDTVAEFVDERKSLKLEIRLIDSSDQVVNHFHEMLIGKFGKAAVKIGNTEESGSLLASPVPVGTTLDQLSLIQTNYQSGKDAATLLTPEGVQVTLIQGSIAAQQVDVIVNTASKDLNLNQGAVSNSILLAAGPNLQTECKTKLPNGLTPGQILITTGCSLKCKHVYHGACEQWDGGKGKAEQVIRDLLKSVFANGHQNQITSIAIPALGTGNLGTPRETVSAIMYAEAEAFSKANPSTTLKDIRFVVFDKPTIDVFQQHVNRLCNPSAVTIDKTLKNKNRRQLKQDGAAGSSTCFTPEKTVRPAAQDETEAAAADADADIFMDIPKKTVKIKTLVMEIKEGDITQENTDAIVNSTNKELNLSGGAVTKAILQTGGRSIADECKALGKTNKYGVAVTGAGNLKCKYIIHLATPEKLYLGNDPEGKAWEDRILNCLKEAERMKLTSVAFPLLGTGIRNASAGEMAINILNAVGEFAYGCKPKHLKVIRITIFQPSMVEEFFTALQKRLSEKKTSKGMLGRFTGWLSSLVSWDSSGSNEVNDEFEMIDDNSKTSLMVDYKSIFRVYGLSQTVIDKVLVELEDLVKDAVTDKVLDSPDQQEAIGKLTPDQIRQLERDAANHQVKATVEKGRKLNRIRLQGDAKDITDVIFNVVTILKEVEMAELRRNEVARIAQQAHWEFKDVDGEYESYPPDINAIIEQAFKSKVGFAQWDEDDGQFKIDFKTNTEENLKNQQKTEVRRIGDDPIEEPKNWDPMNIGEGCKLVQVPVGSNEYDEVEKRIKATCQQSCKEIMKIERVQNPSLYQQYAVKKRHMDASAGAGATTERILWHGTSEDTVPQINAHGFNRSYCGKNATYFGKGVYFARDWAYSAQATYSPPNAQKFKFIYQARVLAGEFILGTQDILDAPLKPNETTKRYDSVVDNMQKPNMFVVFRDTHAYPEYLITFI